MESSLMVLVVRLFLFFFFFFFCIVVHAKIPCTSSDYCVMKLRHGSDCVNGYCDNPYKSGCLINRPPQPPVPPPDNNVVSKSKSTTTTTTKTTFAYDDEDKDKDEDEDENENDGRNNNINNNNNSNPRLSNNIQVEYKPRVCTSEDDTEDDTDTDTTDTTTKKGSSLLCRRLASQNGIEYPEIRISNQNWESATFQMWVLQIILSEILDVPVTIDTGNSNSNNNNVIDFYDPQMRFEYGSANDYQSLERSAHDAPNGDCIAFFRKEQQQQQQQSSSADNDDNNNNNNNGTSSSEEYNNNNNNNNKLQPRSCSHVLLEKWAGDNEILDELINNNSIEQPYFAGFVGREGWFIPKITAERDPSLMSYFGMSGEQNRRKLAERFLRPTTWMEYCTEVSEDGCGGGGLAKNTTTTTTTTTTTNSSSSDNNNNSSPSSSVTTSSTAMRPPQSEEEGSRYFVEGLYFGHFRATDENNCTKWPTNFTGHFLDYPCDWGGYFSQQSYWLNISLKGSGPEASGGYSYQHMVEIWNAANYTQSDIIGYWFQPEVMISQSFHRTNFEFQRVQLPPADATCVDARIEGGTRGRCSSNIQDRIGRPEGSCDDLPTSVRRLVSTGLYQLVYNNSDIGGGDDEARRSPAYDVIKDFNIDILQLGEISDSWIQQNGFDTYGYDPRDAVCRWVSEHYEEVIQQNVPRSYPRIVKEKESTSLFSQIEIAVASLAVISTIVSIVITYRQRHRRVFKRVQVEFVYLLLFGLILVSSAALLIALPPNNIRCVSIAWLLNIGYTYELVPLVIKIAAIHHLMQAAQRCRRVTLKRSLLFGVIGFLSIIVVVYMIVWTILDPPRKRPGYYLLDDIDTNTGHTIVTLEYHCASNSPIWMFVSISVQAFLLLCASILAFMTRKLQQDVNETNTICFLIYWNFVCVLLRFVLFVLLKGGNLHSTTAYQSLSIILSADSFATIGIYFIPKFISTEDNRDGTTRNGNLDVMAVGLNTFGLNIPKSGRLLKALSLNRFSHPNLPKPNNQQQIALEVVTETALDLAHTSRCLDPSSGTNYFEHDTNALEERKLEMGDGNEDENNANN